MNLITLFLTIASICVGVALAAIGSVYLGILLALTAIVIATSLTLSGRLSSPSDSARWQKAFSGAEPQRKGILSAGPIQWFIPAVIGAALGAGLVLLAATSGFIPNATARPATSISEDYRELELFGKVFDIVRADYVDKPDDQKLIASAINGMVTGLDPHSSYMDAKSFDEMQADTSGEFGGLGMQLTVDDGLIKVVSPIDGTPASKAGILAGDIIAKVNGEPIKGWRWILSLPSCADRSEVGSSWKLPVEASRSPSN